MVVIYDYLKTQPSIVV